MPVSTSKTLLKKLKQYAESVCKDVKRLRSNKPEEWSEYDYPRAVSICCYSQCLRKGRSRYSRIKSYINEITFEPTLYQELKNVCVTNNLDWRKIPQKFYKNNGTEIYVGTCAEDDAANQVLRDAPAYVNYQPPIKNLNFSVTIRPRTQQKIDFCQTCKTIFGL